MTQRRALAHSQDRGDPPSLSPHDTMSHRVDAAMDPVQSPSGDPVGDRATADSKPTQLLDAHHAVLAAGKCRDPRIPRGRAHLCIHAMHNWDRIEGGRVRGAQLVADL